jgi:hypothetical protein
LAFTQGGILPRRAETVESLSRPAQAGFFWCAPVDVFFN